MACFRVAVLVALVGGGAGAAAAMAQPPTDDPLQSADCRRALDSLQTQETIAGIDAQASERTGVRPPAVPVTALLAARQRAAQSCLASHADVPARPQRFGQPPVAVSPIAISPLATAPAPRTPLPIGRVETAPQRAAPWYVLSCDAAGCWANDGSRLNRAGPNLQGSRGLCTLRGTLLQCP